MSEEEALDAYGWLPLSFIPNVEGQTEEAVRHYAQGAGYGFFFTKEGAMLSFAEGKGRGGHALGFRLPRWRAPTPTVLEAQRRLSGEVNYLQGNDPTKPAAGVYHPRRAPLRGAVAGDRHGCARRGGASGKGSGSTSGQAHRLRTRRLGYRGAEGLKVWSGAELRVQTSLGHSKGRSCL